MSKKLASSRKDTSQFKNKWELKFLVIKNNDEQTQCAVCSFIFNVPKYSNVQRHYERRHKATYELYSQDKKIALINTFKLNLPTNDVELPLNISFSCLEASFEVSLEIARNGKCYTNGNYIKSCAIKIAKAFNNEEMVEQFECVQLSRQTVSRRVCVLSSNSKEKLRTMINICRYFSLCLDESTDVSDTSQLLIFVRIVQDDFTTNEELLAMKPLHDTTKGVDIYAAFMAAVNDYSNNLLAKCSCIVTDGAAAMTGKIKGFAGLLKKNGINCPTLHCIVHQEALCGKVLQSLSAMKVVVRVTNLIRGGNRALSHRKLKTFLKELNTEYCDLLLHSDIRWLSAGKCLVRFFSLRKELANFLENYVEDSLALQAELRSSSFLCELAFLTDITAHLNELNLQLQGKNQTILHCWRHVNGFINQLILFSTQIAKNDLTHFPSCNELLINDVPDADFSSFKELLEKILKEFNTRFQDFHDLRKDISLFANPIAAKCDDQNPEFQLELCNLQADLMHNTKSSCGENFYKHLSKDTYPKLYDFGLKMTSMFGSTYICECTFSIMKNIKTDKRSRLADESLENLIRLATTKLSPDIKEIVSKTKQKKLQLNVKLHHFKKIILKNI